MEIGQKIKWEIQNKNCKGIYKRELDNNLSEVICTEINGISYVLKISVLTNLLIKC